MAVTLVEKQRNTLTHCAEQLVFPEDRTRGKAILLRVTPRAASSRGHSRSLTTQHEHTPPRASNTRAPTHKRFHKTVTLATFRHKAIQLITRKTRPSLITAGLLCLLYECPYRRSARQNIIPRTVPPGGAARTEHPRPPSKFRMSAPLRAYSPPPRS